MVRNNPFPVVGSNPGDTPSARNIFPGSLGHTDRPKTMIFLYVYGGGISSSGPWRTLLAARMAIPPWLRGLYIRSVDGMKGK